MADERKRGWGSLDDDERERILDLVSTVILSIAVVLTAFSAWESTLWGGEQAEAYARAGSLRGQSNAALTEADEQIGYDATSFGLAMQEYFSGNDAAVEFFEKRLFREEFQPAVNAWLATDPLTNPDAPKTPFDMPEYQNAKRDESQALSAQAEEELAYGDEANSHGDDYVLTTVFFAAVLFFTGIVTKFKNDGVRFGSIAMATIALVGSVAFMLTLPRIFAI
jgi:nitrate/nitrite-specific signal transduction histidine kinase